MRHPWACQKQPLTKMTFRRDGKTMSGVPGRSRRCKRNLYPREWRTRRTATSGAVSLPRMRDINALLLSGDRLSAMMQNSIPSKQDGTIAHYYSCGNRRPTVSRRSRGRSGASRSQDRAAHKSANRTCWVRHDLKERVATDQGLSDQNRLGFRVAENFSAKACDAALPASMMPLLAVNSDWYSAALFTRMPELVLRSSAFICA